MIPSGEEMDALRALVVARNQLGVLQWMDAHGEDMIAAVNVHRSEAAAKAAEVPRGKQREKDAE